MGEPLSTGASIIAVLQLAASVAGYINTAIGATKERKRLREEVRACQYILHQLKDEVDDSEEGTAWLETVEALEAPDAPLGRLWTALNTVKLKLRPKEGIPKTLVGLKWPFSEKEVEKMFAAIEREKALLELALQNNSRKLIQQIKKTTTENKRKLEDLIEAVHNHSSQFVRLKDGIDGILNDRNEDKTARSREKIVRWLTRIDYAAQQSDYFERSQAGTGQWLLGSAVFTTWVRSSKQTLFCPGIPGVGKTILTSIVIDNLITRFEGNETVGVAYLYCNFKRHSDQTVKYLLMDLLKQLSHRRSSLPDCVEALYSKYEDQGKGPPSFDDVSTTLQSVCRLYVKVFVVVDALDECQTLNGHRSTLLKEIFALQAEHDVNIFATSRFIPEILQIFVDSRSLEIRAHREDVRKYVDSRIPQLPSFVQRKPDLQEEIRDKIVRAVDGMFLLAQLHLDSLVGKQSPKAVRAALKRLPSGPDAYVKTYEEALNRIDAQAVDQVKLAKQALSWIVCAQRPVTTIELRHALAVEIDEPEFDHENISEIEDIISICVGIVTLDTESDIVRLVHHTAQEFFAIKQKEWLPHAQTNIAHTCVTYLSLDVFEAGPCDSVEEFNQRLQSNPLYDYAVHNWGHHARMAATEAHHARDPKPLVPAQPREFRSPDATQRTILAFLSNDKKLSAFSQALFVTGQLGWWIQWNCIDHENVPTHFTAMHTAAYFGLKDVMVSLLQQTHNPNARDNYGRTSLWLAAQNGHVMVVETLLRTAGVNPELKDSKYGDTPLSIAARGGHYEVVKLLLAKEGVDPMPKDTNGSTPLVQASGGGWDAVVELLPSTRGVMSRNNLGLTPITNAAVRGHENVVKLLLARGADPNSGGMTGETPLMAAAYNGHENILKMLLGWSGIDPEPKDKNDRTPLWWAVEMQNEAIVSLLLAEDEIDINCQDTDGNSPLFEAAKLGYQAIFEDLLAQAKKLELDSKNEDGQTPLSAASENGNHGIVKLLLETNAVEPNSPDRRGRTPLHYASAFGNVAVVQLLVARNDVDINVRDKQGCTPLWLAAMKENVEVVRVLLTKSGIDLNCKDENGITPLARLGSLLSNGPRDRAATQVAMLLLEKEGVDVNRKCSRGKSPLYYAAAHGNLSVLELLLKKQDVDVDSRDKDGRTPLSIAAGHGNEAVVIVLLETEGVDPDSKDGAGRTPLAWAAGSLWYPRENMHTGILPRLLAWDGVEVDAKDKGGRTPLSHAVTSAWLAANGDWQAVATMRLLLANERVDINSKDNDGRTPLSHAALSGSMEVVELLIAADGIDINSTDNDGQTALALATKARDDIPSPPWRKKRHRKVVQALSSLTII